MISILREFMSGVYKTPGLYLFIVLLLITAILILIYSLKRSSKNEKEILEGYSTDQNRTVQGGFKFNPGRDEESDVEKVTISRFEPEGENLQEVIDDLYVGPKGSDDPSIEKIFKKDRKLIGLFLTRGRENRLISRELKYEAISQAELRESSKAVKNVDISLLGIENMREKFEGLFVDPYDNVYLETCEDIKKVSSNHIKRKEVLEKAKKWIEKVHRKNQLALEIENIYRKNGVFRTRIREKGGEERHRLVIEEDGNVREYSRGEHSSDNDENFDRDEYTELPFSHGIEVELQVVKDSWNWIDGEQMSIVFEQILDDAVEKIAEARNEVDPLVRDRWYGITDIRKDSKGYEAVHIEYGREDDKEYFSVLGKDSHVSLKTNILEIQTPPCNYLEELKWWSYNIYRIAHEVVKELDIEANLISLGINPVEEYSEGVSFGEHHHVGVEDEVLRKKIYNLYRYLEPHLISLTASSPLSNGKNPNHAFNDQGNLVITEPSYTVRLKRNVEQFRTPPYLPSDQDKEYFKERLGLDSDSVRMVDIYPFSRFDTIETRIFDTQLCTLDRTTIAILLQTLAIYAKEELKIEDIPDIEVKTLNENRKQAIESGLLGKIARPKSTDPDSEIFDTEQNRYFYESWQSIIERLEPYFKELGFEDTAEVKNLMIRLYGHDDLPIEAPINPAQLLIFGNIRSVSEQTEFEELLKYIKERSAIAAADKKQDLWPETIDLDDLSQKEISPV
ncbi:MAG: hypothetical protein ACLFSM_09155 [Thermoplasmata archaeon]